MGNSNHLAPRVGKVIDSKVHRIDEDGNGIIETKESHINIGPVHEHAVGHRVKALKLPGGYARCNTKSIRPSNYFEQIEQLWDFNFPLDPGKEGATSSALAQRGLATGPPKEKYRPVRHYDPDEHGKSDSKQGSPPGSINIGDTYITTIDRISNAGNAMVTVEEYEFNIGEVDALPGAKVEIEITAHNSADCINDWPSFEIGETYTVKIDHQNDAGEAIAVIEDREFNIGLLRALPGMEIEIEITGRDSAKCLTKSYRPDVDTGTAEKTVSVNDRRDNELEYESDGEAHSEREESTERVTIDAEVTEPSDQESQASITTDINSTASAETTSTPTNLSKLRKQAKNDEKVSVPVTTERTSTQEYSRSQKIREYVKARADGACEGCDRQAPFTSVTGDPYLQAHHVHEISDGGSDTIDTVIALCPNCHCRIHHGEDGDAYNEELKDRLGQIEDKL